MSYQLNIEIGERLTTARLSKNLNQWDVARLTGLSQATICTHELGRSEPSFTSFKKYSKVYDLPVDFLRFGQENIKVVPETAKRYKQAFDSLSARVKNLEEHLKNLLYYIKEREEDEKLEKKKKLTKLKK